MKNADWFIVSDVYGRAWKSLSNEHASFLRSSAAWWLSGRRDPDYLAVRARIVIKRQIYKPNIDTINGIKLINPVSCVVRNLDLLMLSYASETVSKLKIENGNCDDNKRSRRYSRDCDAIRSCVS